MEAAAPGSEAVLLWGVRLFLVAAAPDSEKGTLRSLLKGGIVDVYVVDSAFISEIWRGRIITMRS